MGFLEGGLGETVLWPPKNGFPQINPSNHFHNPLDGFLRLFQGIEGRQAEIPRPAGAEAFAGGAHHVGFVQQQIEETQPDSVPGVLSQIYGACSPPNTRIPACCKPSRITLAFSR